MIKTKTFVFGFLLSVGAGAHAEAPDPLRLAFKHDSEPAPLAGALQPGWDVQHYDLDLWFTPSSHQIVGQSTAIVMARLDAPGPLKLHASGPVVSTITVDGADATWTTADDALWVDMPATTEAGAELSVLVSYTSAGNSEYGSGFNWGDPAFSFNEPRGARRWLVVYDDPADKATLTWRVRAPSDLSVVANGDDIETTDNGDGTTTHTFDFDAPIATYLMVVYLGQLQPLVDESGRVPVYTWTSSWMVGPSLDAFANTPDMIETLSELWFDFPWTHYANVVVPFSSAMENTTATTFAESLVTGERAEWVNVHELSHHWWGDYVTLSEWPEIWLNEGFASYGEVLWAEAAYGDDAMKDYLAEQRDSYLAWAEYEGVFPMYDPVYLWGGTVYDKGSFTLHMLRAEVGDDAFFDGLRAYASANPFGNVSTDDLQVAMESTSGEDLSWFFDQWVYQAGEPSFEVGVEQRALEEGGFQVDLHLRQTAEGDWRVPVTIALTLEGGEELRAEGQVEDGDARISLCTDAAVTGETFDPDVALLFRDASFVAYDGAPSPILCGAEADTGSGKPGGDCSCGGSSPRGLGWLAGLGLLALRRRAARESAG